MYRLLRSVLFGIDPETAHTLALKSLQLAYRSQLLNWLPQPKVEPHTVMNLQFPNRIGLAAGYDKNGEYIDALAALGFGFIEVGTVTPKPQSGNPKPRMFRIPEQEALINRLGFNNKGVDYLVAQLKKTKYRGILGVNIGKNATTPLAQAVDDYVTVFNQVWPYASYVTINISSPNTQGLRDLQQQEWLSPLLQALKKAQSETMLSHKKYVPLVVKISPDISDEELSVMAHVFLEEKIDGIIATNTTLHRDPKILSKEAGGLSGLPLHDRSTAVIKKLHDLLKGSIPLIASGGVMNEKTATEKFMAGAELLQVYTGLVYEGPGIIKRLRYTRTIDLL